MPTGHHQRYGGGVELRQIRYAIVVSDELHFHRAAQRLHMTQPSLSRQIKALEHELGVDLFVRTSRGVQLTPAGAEFALQATHAVRAVQTAVRRAQEVGHGVTGHVALGFVASAAVDILPRALAKHRERHPNVVVTLAELTTEQQIRGLESGELDVGLGRDAPPVDGLTIDRLRHEPVVVAVPGDHPLAERTTIGLADLVGSALVKLPRGRARLIDDLIRRIVEKTPTDFTVPSDPVVQEANQYMTLLALVATDRGIALVPDSVRSLRSDGVRYLSLAEPAASTSFTVATRAAAENAAAEQLRVVLVDEFSDSYRPETTTPSER